MTERLFFSDMVDDASIAAHAPSVHNPAQIHKFDKNIAQQTCILPNTMSETARIGAQQSPSKHRGLLQ